MSLPKIEIGFGNGQISAVLPNVDRTFGVLAGATAVVGKFELGTAYTVKGMADVAKLGIIPSVDNMRLYKFLKEFYQEAGEGTEMWIFGFPKATKISEYFTPHGVTGKVPAQELLDSSNGKIRRLFTVYNPSGVYTPVIEKGVDADVWLALSAGQTFAENYTTEKYSAVRIAIEGYAYDGNTITLDDLNEKAYNRMSVLIGDTEPRTGTVINYGAATGVLAGRMAAYPIHFNIGRARSGALVPLNMYIKDTPVELFDVESVHDKSYITFRTHQGKSGYFFSHDPQACSLQDDYHSNTRGDVIDKAYRLTYLVQLEELLDNVYINADGTPDAIWAKDLEGRIETYLLANMGDQLQYKIGDAELPVRVQIDPNQNTVTTGGIKTVIKVKPWGYVEFIETELSYELQTN